MKFGGDGQIIGGGGGESHAQPASQTNISPPQIGVNSDVVQSLDAGTGGGSLRVFGLCNLKGVGLLPQDRTGALLQPVPSPFGGMHGKNKGILGG